MGCKMTKKNLKEGIRRISATYGEECLKDKSFDDSLYREMKTGPIGRAYGKALRLLKPLCRMNSRGRVNRFSRGYIRDIAKNLTNQIQEQQEVEEQLSEQMETAKSGMEDAQESFESEKEYLESRKENQIADVSSSIEDKARKELREQLKEEVKASGLVKEGRYGLEYADDALTDRLGELFLEDILSRLGSRHEDGYRAMTKGRYGIERMEKDRMMTESEMSGIDPVDSKMRSKMAGRKHMDDEDIVVRKPDIEKIDYSMVVAIDNSGSMDKGKHCDCDKQTL